MNLRKELGTLLLKKLAVRVVVLEGDAILLHHVVVEELRGGVQGEAPTIGHTKSLRHFVNIRSEINLPVGNCLHPRLKSFFSEFFDEGVTLVPEIDIKDISLFCTGHPNVRIFIDVLVDDVVCEGNLF